MGAAGPAASSIIRPKCPTRYMCQVMSGTCLRVTFAVLPIAIKCDLTDTFAFSKTAIFWFRLCSVDMLNCTWVEDVKIKKITRGGDKTYRGDHVEMRELSLGFGFLGFRVCSAYSSLSTGEIFVLIGADLDLGPKLWRK